MRSERSGGWFVSLAPGTPIGKYIIQRKLAEGGMAEIFLASSFGPERFEKQVIIKRIRPAIADDAAFVEMFVTEARLASRLNHANIVQVFDFDRHEGTLFIAMEYIRGKSLAQAHQRARELSVPLLPVLASQIVAEVARGLSFAHRLTERGEPLGLVHRDVTPQNVLVSYEGAVKLTDFGIAKAGTRASTVGMLKGKFAYMSPEQARGEPVDSRTDIFALGITLWELLCGGRLFDGDSDIAVLRAVQERTVVPPQQLNPAVLPTLSAIVMRCLERDRARRFQSAQELERALSRYLSASGASPEDTDVGAWMRELFPIEAARTENTDLQPAPIPGRLTGATAAAGPEGEGRPTSTTRPLPSNLLMGAVRGQTLEMGPADPAPAERRTSAETPVVSSDHGPHELSTGRTRRSTGVSKPMFLVGTVGSTVVAVVLAIFLSRRPDSDRQVTPVSASTPQAQQPVRPLQELASPAVPESKPPEVVTAESNVSPPHSPLPKAPAPTAHVKRVPSKPKAASTLQAPIGPSGTLVLTVNPWGEVFIDGQSRGEQVGRLEYELPPGEHQVEVRGPTSWGPKQLLIQSTQTTSQAVRLR
jgi:eukaryotic-like serine/threonine-protein kinase